MAFSGEPPEGLTLKEVARLLEINPRQIQYLRESGTVVPSVLGEGTGSACFYTREDVEKVYLALVCLKGLTYEGKKEVVERVFSSNQVRVVVDLDSVVRLEVSRQRLRNRIAQLFS